MPSYPGARVVLVVLLVVTAELMHAQNAPKPVREVVDWADGPPPPAEIADMAAQTPLIVRVRVAGVKNETIPLYVAGIDELVTTADVKVLEVLDGNVAADQYARPGTLRVSQHGGDTDKGNYILRSRIHGVPFLTPGREYVLFLEWNQRPLRWIVKWGADGIWQIDEGRVTSEGKSDLVRQLLPTSVDDVVQRIRK
jgi:hypothetical protein